MKITTYKKVAFFLAVIMALSVLGVAPGTVMVSAQTATYTVYVTAGTNGSVSASVAGGATTTASRIPNVTHGSIVVFTATPDALFRVSQWSINGNAVAGNTSTQLTHTVVGNTTVAVQFEPIPQVAPPTQFPVTVNNSQLPAGTGANQSGAGNHTVGAAVTINAGTRAGYTFGGWVVAAGGVVLANANSATTTFTMPANAVTVTANWTPTAAPQPPTGPVPGGVTFSYPSNGFPTSTSIWHGANPSFFIDYTLNASADMVMFQWLRNGSTWGNPIDSRTVTNPSNRIWLSLGNTTPWNHGGTWVLRARTYVNGALQFIDYSRTMELFVSGSAPDAALQWWQLLYTPAAAPAPAPAPAPYIPTPAPALMPLPSQPGRTTITPAYGLMESVVHPAPPVLAMQLDNRRVNFTGQPPIIAPGGSLIPVRETFAHLGYSIEWNAGTRTATLRSGTTIITITDGSYQFTVNGNTRRHNAQPAQMVNGYLMVPFEQIMDSIGARAWRDAYGIIHVVQ